MGLVKVTLFCLRMFVGRSALLGIVLGMGDVLRLCALQAFLFMMVFVGSLVPSMRTIRMGSVIVWRGIIGLVVLAFAAHQELTLMLSPWFVLLFVGIMLIIWKGGATVTLGIILLTPLVLCAHTEPNITLPHTLATVSATKTRRMTTVSVLANLTPITSVVHVEYALHLLPTMHLPNNVPANQGTNTAQSHKSA